jgi:predicted metal-dependent HD superfamily phosphohydrolase
MNNIVTKASEYVTDLLTKHLPSVYTYHNLLHTQKVVDASTEIGRNSGLTEDQFEILLLTAWFHDTGFVMGLEGHEGKSIELAEKFLKENNYPPEKIELIKNTISATEQAIKPVDILEMIIRDSDIAYIGMDRFYERTFLLKHEWEIARDKKYTEDEWIKSNLEFLTKAEFYTSYAKSRYEEGKQKNITFLKSLLK